MTREELNVLLADLDAKYGKLEHPVDRERREIAEAEQARRSGPKGERNLTDAEMSRWQRHFEDLIEAERMRLAELILEEAGVSRRRAGQCDRRSAAGHRG